MLSEINESSSDSSSINSEDTNEDKDAESLLPDMTIKNEDTVKSKLRKTLSYKMRKFLFHGSFYVVGVCILIAGGVASQFHPHVDPEEFLNCTIFENGSNSSDFNLL